MQRPPLQQRRQRRALGEAAETGVFLQRGRSLPARVPTSWISSSASPSPPPDRRIPTTPPVSLPPGVRSPPASGVDSSLRDRQFPRGELLHRQPAPLRRAHQQEHLCAGLLWFLVRTSTTYGPVKVWWSRASSAELPTHRALISRSPTFIPIMNAPKAIRVHRVVCCSCATFAQSSVQSSLVTSTRRLVGSTGWRPQRTTLSLFS